MNTIKWASQESLIQASCEAIRDAFWAKKDEYLPIFKTLTYTPFAGVLDYSVKLIDEDGEDLKGRDPVNLTINVEFGLTRHGIDIDEKSCKGNELVMTVKIDNTLSPDGLRFLQKEIVADVDVSLRGMQQELEFIDMMLSIPLPEKFNPDAFGYRG